MKVGIIGYGVVGQALGNWLKKYTNHEVVAHDPPQGLDLDFNEIDCAFICVPVPTLENGDQDISLVKLYVDKIREVKLIPIYCRSTVLPGTCDKLNIYSMPEFLRERHADMDMELNQIICGDPMGVNGPTQGIFPGKLIRYFRNVDCEMAKYMHNVYAATKVAISNTFYDACQKAGANYGDSLRAAVYFHLIDVKHSNVPGHDGKLGFGGKCLPKDLKALAKFTDNSFLNSMHAWNETIRGEKE